MNDVVDMVSIVKVDEKGEVDSVSATNLAKIEEALTKMEEKLSKLMSCTVRIRLRVEYEVLESA